MGVLERIRSAVAGAIPVEDDLDMENSQRVKNMPDPADPQDAETSSNAQSKADAAEASAESYADTEIETHRTSEVHDTDQPPQNHAVGGSIHDASTRAAINGLVSDANLESESGAQSKADSAEASAESYADTEVESHRQNETHATAQPPESHNNTAHSEDYTTAAEASAAAPIQDSSDITHNDTVGGTSGNPHAQSAALSDTTDATTETFTSSGTWQKPQNCQYVVVEVVGAGGGGASGSSGGVNGSGRTAGAGGGGGCIYRTYLPSDLPDTVDVTVGAGGSPGTGNDNGGGGGGNSSFYDVTVRGGEGGLRADASGFTNSSGGGGRAVLSGPSRFPDDIFAGGIRADVQGTVTAGDAAYGGGAGARGAPGGNSVFGAAGGGSGFAFNNDGSDVAAVSAGSRGNFGNGSGPAPDGSTPDAFEGGRPGTSTTPPTSGGYPGGGGGSGASLSGSQQDGGGGADGRVTVYTVVA